MLKRKSTGLDGVGATVDELSRMADTVVEDLHRLSVNLRPSSLDRYGLVAALQQLLEAMRKQTSIDVLLVAPGEPERMPDDVETALYRIVQEATTNIVRYSGATSATVTLQAGEMVRLVVEDNGVGFDVAEALSRGRLGILGMRERAQMLGGTFTIASSPGDGTVIRVKAPVDGAAAETEDR